MDQEMLDTQLARLRADRAKRKAEVDALIASSLSGGRPEVPLRTSPTTADQQFSGIPEDRDIVDLDALQKEDQ